VVRPPETHLQGPPSPSHSKRPDFRTRPVIDTPLIIVEPLLSRPSLPMSSLLMSSAYSLEHNYGSARQFVSSAFYNLKRGRFSPVNNVPFTPFLLHCRDIAGVHQAGASALTQLLPYDPPDAEHRALPCGGHVIRGGDCATHPPILPLRPCAAGRYRSMGTGYCRAGEPTHFPKVRKTRFSAGLNRICCMWPERY